VLERSNRAIAAGPASTGRPGSIHWTASLAWSRPTPSAGRSANCHGVIVARVGMNRSMKRTHDEQNAQSPS